MITIIVILVFASVLLGMFFLSKLLAQEANELKIFEDIYFSFEDVNDIGVVYTKKGDYSAS